jgi:hypothetical protein
MNLDREALRMTWDVVTRQHKMLNQIIPAVGEIVTVFQSEKPPTREQLDRWQKIHDQLTQDMTELTAGLHSIAQLFDPLLFDA